MSSFLRKLRRNEKGNVLILTAGAFPLLVGCAGLATDTIQWALWKRQLQRAADSAAIAGVYERMRANGGTGGVPAAVLMDVGINQHTGIALYEAIPNACPVGAGANSILLCPADDTTLNRHDQVKVVLKVQKPLTFSSMFMASVPVIRAESTAASVPGGDEYCVIGTDPRASVSGINIAGSTTLSMGTCSLMANSSNPTAAATNTGQGSAVVAKSINAVGGVSYSSRWTGVSYHPGTPAVQDPFGPGSQRELTVPPQTSCNTTITVGNGSFPIDRRTVDAPGPGGARKIVCITGGLTVSGAMILGDATYVINGKVNSSDALRMNSNSSSLTCASCTIITTDYSNPANTGDIKITGGTLNVTAPTDGPYRGIAFYQDRRATDSTNESAPANHINGNSGSVVRGVVYMPGRSLLMNGGGSATAPICLQVIGKRVTFSGNSYIRISSLCASEGLDTIGAGRVVRLVA